MIGAREGIGLRLAGAVLVLGGGLLHVVLAFDEYGSTDLIRVFFVNGAASAVVAVWLVLGRGPAPALAGIGLSAGSLLAFGLSRLGDGVLGFRATGLDPLPEAPLTLVLEAAAMGVLLVLSARHRAQLAEAVRDAVPGRR